MSKPNEFECVELRYNPKASASLSIDDPSSYIDKQSGWIALVNADGTEAKIGEFCLSVIDACSASNDRVPLSEVFAEDHDLADYYDALYSPAQYSPELRHFKKKVMRVNRLDDGYFNPTLLIIDHIAINPEHQGKRYGLLAMRALMRRHQRGVLIIAAKPYPPQYEGGVSFSIAREKAKAFGVANCDLAKAAAFAKLRLHFARLGFNLCAYQARPMWSGRLSAVCPLSNKYSLHKKWHRL